MPNNGRFPVAKTLTTLSSPFQIIKASCTGMSTQLLLARFAGSSYRKGKFIKVTAADGKLRSPVNPVSITNSIVKSEY